jgi:hypothetical protein
MLDELKNDIRNTIQQTVREELSNVLANNRQGDKSCSHEAWQSMPTTSSTNTTAISHPGTSQSRGQSSILSFREFYLIREASRQNDFKPLKKQKGTNEPPLSGTGSGTGQTTKGG